MAERSINPKSLGKRSKDKILKKFSRTFQIPLDNEADLIEWLRSTGVKTRKRKPENIAKSMWAKAGVIYNDLIDEEREAEAKRIRERTKKEKTFIKDVVDFTKKPTSSQRTFRLPRAEVMGKILKQLVNSKTKMLMRIGAVSYPLNQAFIERMMIGIANGDYLVENAYGYIRSSDEQAVYELMNATTFTIIILDTGLAKKKKKGAFFKHRHNVPDLDLTKYQISYNDGVYENYAESCFIQSITLFFEKEEIDATEKIARAKSKMITRTMTAQVIEKIAKILEVSISIRDERDVKGSNTSRVDVKNKGCDLTIPLGLIDEHYFLIEEVPITKYALIHHKELEGVNRWNEVIKKTNARDKKRYITSYEVISYMFENKETYLTELSPNDMLGTIHYDIGMNIDVYEPSGEDCREVEYKERGFFKDKEVKETENKWGKTTKEVIDEEVICYFDFESTTDRGEGNEANPHRAYLVVYKTEYMSEPKCIEGKFCGKRMLEDVSRSHGYRPIRFIAHNVKYDFQFLYEHLYQVSKIQRGSMLLSARAEFYVDEYKVKFNFVDSYSFIATKLSAFPKMFGFQGVKEIMPYSLWNSDTIKERVIKSSDCVEYCDRQIVSMNIGKNVSDEEKDDYYNSFIDKAEEWDCIIHDEDDGDHLIDILKYSKMYCIVDVDILQKGYEKFRGWIEEVCGLDINQYITLPSIADAYMKKSGVYDDCFEISGSQLLFIQKAMIGGRTMTSENKMFDFTGDNAIELDDLDAVSLYPSAMKRMGGYLKGMPKVLQTKTYDFLKSVDGYFVEIEITKVGKHKKFPLMSYITDTGVRLWTNEMVGKKIHIDKYALEDLIEFQLVDFNIIKGYYYDEGRNYQIGKTIQHLFNTRKAKKDEIMPDGSKCNPIEQVYKLLMNSAYGRTLLKPFETEKRYISEQRSEAYIVRHYDSITSIQNLHDDSVEITQTKPIIEHYNLAHIGVEVLSMSKRIMNEPMALAEDIGVDIYYQDTDSTHTPVKDIPLLKEAYLKKYGRELEGNEMGMFNCDFSSKKLKGKIRSVESVFLGKKFYIDKLQGDEEGVYDYHIRGKGVSGDAINHKIFEEGGTPIDLYERLFHGEEITFDLCCGGNKSCFETMSDGLMTSRSIFERCIRFGNKEEEE